MAGKKTYSSPQGTLGMPNDFVIGKATGCADCFFDSVAQGMNELCILGGPFNVKSLNELRMIMPKVTRLQLMIAELV